MSRTISDSSLLRKQLIDDGIDGIHYRLANLEQNLTEHRRCQSDSDAYLLRRIDELQEDIAHFRHALRAVNPELSASLLSISSSSTAGR